MLLSNFQYLCSMQEVKPGMVGAYCRIWITTMQLINKLFSINKQNYKDRAIEDQVKLYMSAATWCTKLTTPPGVC